MRDISLVGKRSIDLYLGLNRSHIASVTRVPFRNFSDSAGEGDGTFKRVQQLYVRDIITTLFFVQHCVNLCHRSATSGCAPRRHCLTRLLNTCGALWERISPPMRSKTIEKLLDGLVKLSYLLPLFEALLYLLQHFWAVWREGRTGRQGGCGGRRAGAVKSRAATQRGGLTCCHAGHVTSVCTTSNLPSS